MRVVRDGVLGILRVDAWVQGVAQVVEAVQGVQDVEAGGVAAVVLVPVAGEVVVAVGFARFGVGEEEVAVVGEVVPSGVHVRGGAYVL